MLGVRRARGEVEGFAEDPSPDGVSTPRKVILTQNPFCDKVFPAEDLRFRSQASRTVASRHSFSEKQRAGVMKVTDNRRQMNQHTDENPGNGQVIDPVIGDTSRSMASA
jgi:hypothetical protein